MHLHSQRATQSSVETERRDYASKASALRVTIFFLDVGTSATPRMTPSRQTSTSFAASGPGPAKYPSGAECSTSTTRPRRCGAVSAAGYQLGLFRTYCEGEEAVEVDPPIYAEDADVEIDFGTGDAEEAQAFEEFEAQFDAEANAGREDTICASGKSSSEAPGCGVIASTTAAKVNVATDADGAADETFEQYVQKMDNAAAAEGASDGQRTIYDDFEEFD
eukprot:scaffold1446_cov391-Prasinococcus_capsulatus_cf.AAC.11